ncbi:MAG: phosphodiester glycosidase family protein [Candidatus Marinimicrobia bacterium]|nr:phosphodiester glycosidase family protein [Candidatus Neomarinimicrobiota bacterium]MCF7839466.1 phosphodiester glycosidase family protein [Candidatus Neomarinimicrobiota bacterium]MCF7901858.1 phosphodiester glycosidase family protein [Candidatus Neomarinimicrobiota bacterium]
MRPKIFVVTIFSALLVLACTSTQNVTCERVEQQVTETPNPITLIQVKSDTLFHSNQRIHMVALPKAALEDYALELRYSAKTLHPTSWFGETYGALAAVNGGYFDMDAGGSVTYLEIQDSVICWTQPDVDSLKWAFPDSLISGAVILTKSGNLVMEAVQPDSMYAQSSQEAAVLVVGPLLLQEGQKVSMPKANFVANQHPRSYLATTPDEILLISVDGRSKSAQGMSLYDAQEYLLSLGCLDAINLDGGGSTTLWVRGQGIVSHPSDLTGERKVANAFVIVPRSKSTNN